MPDPSPAGVLRRIIIRGALVLGLASPASAQAFIPARGEGTISVSYQYIVTRGQHDHFGTWFPNVLQNPALPQEFTDTHALIWYVEYGLSDRVAVHASLPYAQVRYEGPVPHRIGFNGQPSDLDDGTFHGSFQDFYFGTRFKLVESPRLALTPFAEVIIPSHRYEILAKSAVGRDLRALVVGAAVGGFADYLLPGLHFQTRMSYALVQEEVDIRANRTGIDSSVGYFVTPRLAVQFIQTFQFTHDGIDWVEPPAILAVHDGTPMTPEHRRNHDRLARSSSLNFGGAVSFQLTEKIGVFATTAKLAWGQNLSAPQSLTVGMNLGFQTGRSSRVSPNVNRRVH
ncbi:MAG TPA: hypothetical protein VH701_03460 [Vicinamibacterales bacterium]|jgi:hypothetical protein